MKPIRKVILLGSGALKIGEAGEFDYSGSQAIKAFNEEGIETILVNPNIATIQTSEKFARRVYFLPVTPFFVEKVIHKEKPDSILVTFGGQTALNCGIHLHKSGILHKNKVTVLGTSIETIIDTEDRVLFSRRLQDFGLKTARGQMVRTVGEALKFAQWQGYPVMIRTGYALGGIGSGIARNAKELRKLSLQAFAVMSQVIVEECLWGWKEIEYEIIRDRENNCIAVCNMENIDPVGIHTGESMVVAPSQTLTDKEYFTLRDIAIKTIQQLHIIGECNIQFALHPQTGAYRIIEVNARLSRSSALASKATGYPLAYISAKLALGQILPNLKNSTTKITSAFFEPALDYIVVKMPRWDLDKYEGIDQTIGSEMKSVGEVMAIARTFEEGIQKAVRSLCQGHEGVIDEKAMRLPLYQLRKKLGIPDPKRIFIICASLMRGVPVFEIVKRTGIDRWYIDSLNRIVSLYKKLKTVQRMSRTLLIQAKEFGFSDAQIASYRNTTEYDIRSYRKKYHICPYIKHIDTMAGEFPAKTNYLYLTYSADRSDSMPLRQKKKVIVLGSGPYAIGTSVEFDWCAVNTVQTLRTLGIQSVMINCNPETVSTDFDYSNYLYFEELSLERILDIWELEKETMKSDSAGIIVSVGGQIPNNLAHSLEVNNIRILGSDATSIDLAENRHKFSRLLDGMKIPQPVWREVHTERQSLQAAQDIGYPVIIRPSFVLSGTSMLVIENDHHLKSYISSLRLNIVKHPLIITKYLTNARECDLDGVAQYGEIKAYALSEHIEHGGVHSGDSTLVLPPMTVSRNIQYTMVSYARKILRKLRVNGPFNIQYLILDNMPRVIECNLRASRSFPFVSKTIRKNLIRMATRIALGIPVKEVKQKNRSYVSVKVPQFSFKRLRGADPALRVEMSSTGEVATFGQDVHEAYLKSIIAAGMEYPQKNTVFLSLGGEQAKDQFLAGVRSLTSLGYELYATSGTHGFLKSYGITSTMVGKIRDGTHPNFRDLLMKKIIGFSVILPERFTDATKSEAILGLSDGFIMRRMSIDFSVPIFTNVQSAMLFVQSLSVHTAADLEIKHWGEYGSQ